MFEHLSDYGFWYAIGALAALAAEILRRYRRYRLNGRNSHHEERNRDK